ncbi:MAG: 50S ribosomal protein L18e [archaeon]
MKTNPNLCQLIADLKKASAQEKAGIWKRIASDLAKSSSRRRVVNIAKINRYASEDETVIVPGKVLGVGTLEKKITVSAYQFSAQAKSKIIDAKGRCMTIPELMKSNLKGTKVRILG